MTSSRRPDEHWVHGGEIGVVNVDFGGLTGAQIGVFNTVHEMRGVQIGVVNRCGRLRGLQLGVLNLCDRALMRILPVFNVGW